jgi:hypothetical protein
LPLIAQSFAMAAKKTVGEKKRNEKFRRRKWPIGTKKWVVTYDNGMYQQMRRNFTYIGLSTYV